MKLKLPQPSYNLQTRYPVHSQSYQPETMKNEIPLPYYFPQENS